MEISRRNRLTENVTAGWDILGDFAPKFAELNDNMLFDQVWAHEEQLSPRDRSVVTVTVLVASGVLDTPFRARIEIAKSNDIICDEMVKIPTHAAFYAGWSKAWAALCYAKEIYAEQIFTVLQHSAPL